MTDCIHIFSKKWWKNFKRRHPEFSGVRPKKTDIIKQKMYIRKDVMESFFENYTKLQQMYAFENYRIWNVDETESKQQEDHTFEKNQNL